MNHSASLPRLCRWLVFGLAVWILGVANAASPIVIGNPSFESPTLADGGYANGNIPSWTISSGAQAGVENPVNGRFDGTSDPLTGLPDGKQLAWLNTVGNLSQTLTTKFVAEARYRLTVHVGVGKGGIAGDYTVELRADGVKLASANPTLVVGGFVTATAIYDCHLGDVAVGKSIEIVLAKPATVAGAQACFDNVQLTVDSIPPSLVAHWRFDETSGVVAYDSSGAHDGTLSATGAAFVTGGVAGGALALDRLQNGFVRVPHLTNVLGTDFSVVVWVKLPVGDTTQSCLISQNEQWQVGGFLINSGVGPSVGWGQAGRASLLLNDYTHTAVSTSPINDGQWHQVVCIYRLAGKTGLYVDGAPVESELPSVPLVDRDVPFLIGGVQSIDTAGVSRGFFSGSLDEVQLYSRALSDAEVGELYHNPGNDLGGGGGPLDFLPANREFVGSVDVIIRSHVAGATVHYTLDGTDPVVTSPAYVGAFTLQDTATVKAALFVNQFPVSEVVSATYTRLPSIGIDPPGGLFTNEVDVTIVNRLGLGKISYTVDGSAPVLASPVYTVPLHLVTNTTLNARVYLNGFPISEVFTAVFARVYALDDGIPAAWRQQYFGPGYLTDPRAAGDADPDGDGWTNQREYAGGTDPTDKNSVPIELGIQAVPTMTWNSQPGRTYQILRKESVNALTDWEIIVPAFQATETTSRYTDFGAPWTAVYQIKLLP